MHEEMISIMILNTIEMKDSLILHQLDERKRNIRRFSNS